MVQWKGGGDSPCSLFHTLRLSSAQWSRLPPPPPPPAPFFSNRYQKGKGKTIRSAMYKASHSQRGAGSNTLDLDQLIFQKQTFKDQSIKGCGSCAWTVPVANNIIIFRSFRRIGNCPYQRKTNSFE